MRWWARGVVAGGLGVLLVLGACGQDEEGPDRASHLAVYEAAMEAVAARDLESLRRLLTQDGWARLERLLRDWQTQLRDPVQGRFILELVRERRGVLDPTEVDLARYGTIEDAWDFYLKADPRQPQPRRREPRVYADGNAVTIDYEDPHGTYRTVRLVRSPMGWYVDDLQL